MLKAILSCAALGGCGFQSKATPGGGPPDAAADAADHPIIDGAIDGTIGGATDCLQRWFDGDLPLSMPQALTTLQTSGDERDPWISHDRLTLYYALDLRGSDRSDIYRATRGSPSDPFGNAMRLTNLDTTSEETRASLTMDQTTLVLASDRVNGEFDIYLTSRDSTTVEFPSADTRHVVSVNTAATSHFDPFLTADGKKLYLTTAPIGLNQHIAVATRSDPGGDFGAPSTVRVINDPGSADADPSVSEDDRLIVFSSFRPTGLLPTGGTHLWYATRQDAMGDFGSPKPIPLVNSNDQDSDPMLSADGCELYFASTRGAGKDYDLYVSRIAP